MPSFQDSAVIFFLALLLFGPKKLPELARQLGKLMGEFRRASNEFRMQMEDELRAADQEEQRKKVAAMEAAAPIAPLLAGNMLAESSLTENTIAPPASPESAAQVQYGEDHPHLPPPAAEPLSEEPQPESPGTPAPAPLPIATSGDLNLMPPSTGLPLRSSALAPILNSIPHLPEPESNVAVASAGSEATQHG